MARLVRAIHVLAVNEKEDVDDPPEAGHDEGGNEGEPYFLAT
jgi:hypothetical protein